MTLQRIALIKRIETKHCPNSRDGDGQAASHYVKDGACAICDRSIGSLARLHNLA